jgi:hypothetical protein
MITGSSKNKLEDMVRDMKKHTSFGLKQLKIMYQGAGKNG